MFDIGFWEIAVIAVVALLVVGPEEFPALVRTIGGWIGKIRRFLTDTKDELDREFRKAEELKKLVEKEAEIVERHRNLDLNETIVPATEPARDSAQEETPQDDGTRSPSAEDAAAKTTSHGTPE